MGEADRETREGERMFLCLCVSIVQRSIGGEEQSMEGVCRVRCFLDTVRPAFTRSALSVTTETQHHSGYISSQSKALSSPSVPLGHLSSDEV